LNRSDFGLVRTKFLNPTNLNPVWVSVSLPIGYGKEIVVEGVVSCYCGKFGV
jgi:hypothetical protein